MSARSIIESMVGLTDERQNELGDEVSRALEKVERGQSWVIDCQSPMETVFVSNMVQGVAFAQPQPVKSLPDGRSSYPVKITRMRNRPADISLWATVPDTP